MTFHATDLGNLESEGLIQQHNGVLVVVNPGPMDYGRAFSCHSRYGQSG